ncbi:hypothetical protein [Sulfurovum sp.]|uniref:hypothetical protein n=1 Tax=Sulfurovum sp. TaxID=1969726 RepID=UPI0025E0037A|nr:hypothetical protein [Sulfurovum sp.]
MENGNNKKIIISGIDIPFMDLVVLLVKLAFAAIPAMIVIFTVFGILSALFGGVFNMFMFRV